MNLEENTQLRDYKIIRKIGEGGMGEVFLASDEDLGRNVAIKVLPVELARNQEIIERFRQEARLQASLIHPNIVSLFTFFREQNTYFMILEYAQGITLKQLIKKNGPIPEQRALKIFRQILEGVSFAHNKGIIHRDLKPSNIMVDNNDNIKIMDFGIAKVIGDRGLTKTGAKVGTIYYMSPEQIRAEKNIDRRTDIYSLGICLFEMLTGRLPFNTETESDFEVMKEIVEDIVPDPRSLYPHISSQTVTLLNKMVEKNKSKRLQNCKDCLNINDRISEEENYEIEEDEDEEIDEDEYATNEEEEEFVCDNCSESVPKEAKFCPKCKQQFEENNQETDNYNNPTSSNGYYISIAIIGLAILLALLNKC